MIIRGSVDLATQNVPREANDLLADLYTDARSVPAVFCGALAEQFEELSAIDTQLKDILNIDDQSGITLDLLGRLFNERRLWPTDEEYRHQLKAALIRQHSSGQIEALNAILRLLLPENGFNIGEYPIKSMVINILGAFSGHSDYILSVLKRAKEAVTKIFVSFSPIEQENWFLSEGDWTARSTKLGYLANGVSAGVYSLALERFNLVPAPSYVVLEPNTDKEECIGYTVLTEGGSMTLSTPTFFSHSSKVALWNPPLNGCDVGLMTDMVS